MILKVKCEVCLNIFEYDPMDDSPGDIFGSSPVCSLKCAKDGVPFKYKKKDKQKE